MKTSEEISDRIKEVNGEDYLGFSTEVLVGYLPYEYAKEFLAEEATEEEWKNDNPSEKQVKEDMEEYMGFALGKCEDHRGISAGRSISKMVEWLWLLGDDELVRFANDDDNYMNYGAPILKKICDKYEIENDILKTEAFTNMSERKPCCSGCDEGCGR